MKKKLKLLLSLASFCMAIAALCFGVLAANQITYNISGTISYKVDEYYATITTNVYKSTFIASGNDATAKQASLQEHADTLKNSGSTGMADMSNVINSYTYNTLDKTGTEEITGLNFKYGKGEGQDTNVYYSYYIVIEVANISDLNFSVKLQLDTTEDFNGTNANSIVYKSADIDEVVKGTPAKIVLAFSLDDKTKSISGEGVDFKYNVILDKVALLKQDTQAGYYYIEMGTYEGQPVRWRLIGTTEDISDAKNELRVDAGNGKYYYHYTYNPDLMPSGTTGVFYQELYNNNRYFDNDSNDYFVSDIRNYLKDTTVDGFLNKMNIQETNSIYTQIIGRKVSEMVTYKINNVDKNGYFTSSNVNTCPTYSDEDDLFWLLSIHEIMYLFGNETEWTISKYECLNNYWTRNAVDGNGWASLFVLWNGECSDAKLVNESMFNVRPAFLFAI